jgi:flagella basal body P-ring formation protein FlgA
MKQASNSLLTLCSNPFEAMACVSELPREEEGTMHRHLTPFCIYREVSPRRHSILPGISCSPRSSVRFRLGEGRIRSLLHGMCFVLVTVCFALQFLPNLWSAENSVVRLKETASVRLKTVHLKDVADLQGPDPDLLNRLGQISLGPSPEFGLAKILSRRQISELIQSVRDSLPAATLEGAPAVQIKLQGRPITFEDIAPLLLTHLLQTTSWNDSEIKILSIGNLQGMEMPLENAVLRLSARSAIKGLKNLLVPIEILQDGKTLRSFWITARIEVRARILTAARKIPRGKIIDSSDVVETTTEIPDLCVTYVRQLKEILGKAARASLSAGDPLTYDSFMKPFLVMKGETVQLRLERDGIILTSPVRAEQNGRLGQIIKVRNLDFSTVLKAQVTGKAKVEMQ